MTFCITKTIDVESRPVLVRDGDREGLITKDSAVVGAEGTVNDTDVLDTTACPC